MLTYYVGLPTIGAFFQISVSTKNVNKIKKNNPLPDLTKLAYVIGC